MTWQIKERTFLERETVMIPSKKARGKGQGFADFWRGAPGESDAAMNVFIRFLKHRMKNEYTQEIDSFTGTHNSRQIDQR